LSALRKQTHHSKILQNHFNKYGEADLIFSVLVGCDKKDLLKMEQYFIDSYNPFFNVLKVAIGGNAIIRPTAYKKGHIPWATGRKFTEEHRKRIGDGNRGRIVSKEGRMRMSLGQRKKVITPELREKYRMAHLGEKQSKERIAKRVAANTGQKRSEETKAKIGAKSREMWAMKKLAQCALN
jgi:group I intron endonuclease